MTRLMLRSCVIVVSATCVAMAFAPGANAGTFTITDLTAPFGPPVHYFFVSYSALPGEINRVSIDYDLATKTFELKENGVAPLLPAADDFGHTATTCAFRLRTVRCARPSSGFERAFVDLDNLDDKAEVTLDSGSINLAGGPGDDELDARRVVAGGTVLAGGSGDDEIRGGPGGDQLFPGHGSNEVYGGDGGDTLYHNYLFLVSYNTGWASDNATAGVSISLDDVANDGQPGEAGNIHSDVESVMGTGFSDTLIGDGDGNGLLGLEGDDVIDGGAGADFIVGESGSDTLTGGPGSDHVYGNHGSSNFPVDPPDDDALFLRDGEVDTYACSSGSDTVTGDVIDVFGYVFGSPPNDCEMRELT